MNADLERTVSELGAEYRGVVDRLRSAREIEPKGKTDVRQPTAGVFLRRAGYLVAASLFAVIALSILFQGAPQAKTFPARSVYTVAYAPTEEALEVIVASQRADGSWSNDFLTRQNAAALRASREERMRIAYRRAVRYLRTKGLEPLTDDELRKRGEYAAKTLAGNC